MANQPAFQELVTAMTRAIFYKYHLNQFQEPYFRDMNTPEPTFSVSSKASWRTSCGIGMFHGKLPGLREQGPVRLGDLFGPVFVFERCALIVQLLPPRQQCSLRIPALCVNMRTGTTVTPTSFNRFSNFLVRSLQQQLSRSANLMRRVSGIGVFGDVHVVHEKLAAIETAVGLSDAGFSRSDGFDLEPTNWIPAVNPSVKK